METYELVRRAVFVGGMSRREASREFGVNRRTVDKMLEHPSPPGYRIVDARKRPKSGPYLGKIEEILKVDEGEPKKQHHTAVRIYERLRDEFGYTGGPCQVRRAVKAIRDRACHEAFVPLVSLPGEAQADFGESVVEIAGVRMKAHGFVSVLPFSGVWFMRMYPAENAESFCEGNARSFGFFGGVPRRIVYDNPAYAVNRRAGGLKGRDRDLAQMFGELRSACLFEAAFAAPRKGNEKGSVERKVGSLRSSLMVPVPKAASFAELNARLLEKALDFKAGSELFAQDARALLAPADYEPCRLVAAKADKLCLVRFEGSSYSVPSRFALRSLLVRATPFNLEILSSKQIVAVHERSLTKGRVVTKLAHYLDLLERKPRAARTALPVLQAGLPDAFELYRKSVEDGTGDGDRRFVAALRLCAEFGPERVAGALSRASNLGLTEPVDIRLLMLKEAEQLPLSLCIDWKLPDGRKSPTVERPPLSEYAHLLAAGAR